MEIKLNLFPQSYVATFQGLGCHMWLAVTLASAELSTVSMTAKTFPQGLPWWSEAKALEGLGLIPGWGMRSHMLQLRVNMSQLRVCVPQRSANVLLLRHGTVK